MSRIQIGDSAPDFDRVGHNGETVSLAAFRGEKVVVLYFYPGDGTPVCTKQACAFRDAHEAFADAGAVVIGVSTDSLDSHRAFAATHQLPFLLLADEDGSLRKAYGVPKSFGILPGRVTYVIDKRGVVRHVFHSPFSAGRHVAEALRIVQQLVSE